MKLLIPYADYNQAANCLDSDLLNTQIISSAKLLRYLLNGGWRGEPGIKMWAGYESALCRYTQAMMFEYMDRGYSVHDESWEIIGRITIGYGWDRSIPDSRPQWLGNPILHNSHRANLLHKGILDILQKRAKLLIGGGQDYLEYATKYGYKKFEDFTLDECADLHIYLSSKGIGHYDNWYAQFGWNLSPSDVYFYPSND